MCLCIVIVRIYQIIVIGITHLFDIGLFYCVNTTSWVDSVDEYCFDTSIFWTFLWSSVRVFCLVVLITLHLRNVFAVELMLRIEFDYYLCIYGGITWYTIDVVSLWLFVIVVLTYACNSDVVTQNNLLVCMLTAVIWWFGFLSTLGCCAETVFTYVMYYGCGVLWLLVSCRLYSRFILKVGGTHSSSGLEWFTHWRLDLCMYLLERFGDLHPYSGLLWCCGPFNTCNYVYYVMLGCGSIVSLLLNAAERLCYVVSGGLQRSYFVLLCVVGLRVWAYCRCFAKVVWNAIATRATAQIEGFGDVITFTRFVVGGLSLSLYKLIWYRYMCTYLQFGFKLVKLSLYSAPGFDLFYLCCELGVAERLLFLTVGAGSVWVGLFTCYVRMCCVVDLFFWCKLYDMLLCVDYLQVTCICQIEQNPHVSFASLTNYLLLCGFDVVVLWDEATLECLLGLEAVIDLRASVCRSLCFSGLIVVIWIVYCNKGGHCCVSLGMFCLCYVFEVQCEVVWLINFTDAGFYCVLLIICCANCK
eukprot:gene3559-2510_t